MFGNRFLLAALLSSVAVFGNGRAIAQIITPDRTLGTESSILTSGVEVKGNTADLIEGGAERGTNLFHSFSDFSIPEANRVYFANPVGIESILSRVTGGNLSNISGLLGVDGSADLWLINPSGIVFGSDAVLDIEGSFHATTADAITIGEGVYSAIEPEQSQLLVVKPSTSFYNNSPDRKRRGLGRKATHALGCQ